MICQGTLGTLNDIPCGVSTWGLQDGASQWFWMLYSTPPDVCWLFAVLSGNLLLRLHAEGLGSLTDGKLLRGMLGKLRNSYDWCRALVCKRDQGSIEYTQKSAPEKIRVRSNRSNRMENQSLTTFFLFLAPKKTKIKKTKKIIVVLPNFLSSKRTRLEDARRLSYPTKEPFSSLRGRSTPFHSWGSEQP